jgi:hypothetical protein
VKEIEPKPVGAEVVGLRVGLTVGIDDGLGVGKGVGWPS